MEDNLLTNAKEVSYMILLQHAETTIDRKWVTNPFSTNNHNFRTIIFVMPKERKPSAI